MSYRPQPYHVRLGLLREGWLREGFSCGGPPASADVRSLYLEDVLCSPTTLERFLFRFPLGRPAFF